MLLMVLFLASCRETEKKTESFDDNVIHPSGESNVSLIILGTVQDGGSPQLGCENECCTHLFNNPALNRKVVSLGLIDRFYNKTYLFEATPAIARQLQILKNTIANPDSVFPSGIFITHAHIGHYTGLMYLRKEAGNTQSIPVYTMPKLKTFLSNNGPWSQLVANRNIILRDLAHNKPVQLTSHIQVMPFTVPHRDEFSETVGFKIIGPNKKVLFIPDIDKWDKWETNISDAIASVDYAFLDATFYDGEEIDNRDISLIPHPFVIESTSIFDSLTEKEKDKIYFIHFNHTNPLLNSNSEEFQNVLSKGYHAATANTVLDL